MAMAGILLLIGAFSSSSAVRVDAAGERPKDPECTESIPDVFDRVSPAVVFIATTTINPYNALERVSHAVGSGILIDSSGLILTNSHVVYGRQVITVTLDDGTNLPAQLVGADPIFDLALVRITPPSSGRLPAATLGDSDRLRVGEEVFAVGNPLGLDQTLTRGIVSAMNRILPDTLFSLQEPLIQTDTPINPGNSGGPLLDRCGEVIGITTAVILEAQNIGFAIPSNLAKTVLPSLKTQGRVVRPWLGVQGQLVSRALRDLFRMPLVDGLLVEVVEPGSPAERAGLQGGHLEVVIDERPFLLGGDIITSVNGVRLVSSDALFDVMSALKVGSQVHMTVYREGTTREVDCVLPERPALPGDFPEQRTLAPVAGRGSRLGLPGLFP
jgi:S1-C subfamily serine protease